MKFLRCLFVVLAGMIGLMLAPEAGAWGCKGHQTVAYIAAKHLTPEARQFVQKLLQENPIDPTLRRYCGSTSDLMADVSSWPDDVRNDRKNGPWHYIDIPRGARKGPLDAYCGQDGCITRAIAEQLAILKDKSADGLKRAEALRYLIHFVGDLHQPLHAITNGDNGGNCIAVRYLRYEPLLNEGHPERESYSPNLHSIWDTEIVERDMEISNPRRYADALDESFRAQIPAWEAAGIHVDEWAWESFTQAEEHVYGPLRVPVEAKPDAKPATCSENDHVGRRMFERHLAAGDSYQAQAGKVVEARLVQAGVRLAMILNEAAR